MLQKARPDCGISFLMPGSVQLEHEIGADAHLAGKRNGFRLMTGKNDYKR